jgi:hypothetical protein
VIEVLQNFIAMCTSNKVLSVDIGGSILFGIVNKLIACNCYDHIKNGTLLIYLFVINSYHLIVFFFHVSSIFQNKKERKKVREVGILKKDPESIREQIEKLEKMSK